MLTRHYGTLARPAPLSPRSTVPGQEAALTLAAPHRGGPERRVGTGALPKPTLSGCIPRPGQRGFYLNRSGGRGRSCCSLSRRGSGNRCLPVSRAREGQESRTGHKGRGSQHKHVVLCGPAHPPAQGPQRLQHQQPGPAQEAGTGWRPGRAVPTQGADKVLLGVSPGEVKGEGVSQVWARPLGEVTDDVGHRQEPHSQEVTVPPLPAPWFSLRTWVP